MTTENLGQRPLITAGEINLSVDRAFAWDGSESGVNRSKGMLFEELVALVSANLPAPSAPVVNSVTPTGAYLEQTTPSSDVVLSGSSKPYQWINPSTHINVTVPASAPTFGFFNIVNFSATYTVTLRNSNTDILRVLTPGSALSGRSGMIVWHGGAAKDLYGDVEAPGSLSMDPATTDYLAKFTNVGIDDAKVNSVILLLKDEHPDYDIGVALWADLRAGFICRSDCNAGAGVTLYDLTANNRHLTMSSTTWEASRVSTASGGQIYRPSPSAFLPVGSGAPFSLLVGFGTQYDQDLGHVLSIGGNHNDGDATRIYIRETASSPNYIREIGSYISVKDYSGSDPIDVSMLWANSGTGDKRYMGGSATPTTGGGVRNLGDDGFRMWKRSDGNFAKSGKLYYLLCFDDEISSAAGAAFTAALNTILGVTLTG